MKTLAKMYRGQYRAVEEAAETWKADHDEAMAVCDLEEIIRACLLLNNAVRHLVACAWKAGFAGKIVDPERIGKAISKVLEAGVEAWESLMDGAEDAAVNGYEVEGAENIRGALDEMRRLAEDFDERWPVIRKEDAERGAREIAAGRFVTGEELFREIRTQDS